MADKITIKPHGCKVLIEPITRAGQYADDLKKRSGLLMSTPKHQGIPNTGIVYVPNQCVHEDDKPEEKLEAGMTVVFQDDKPAIITHDGKTLFAIDRPKVIAILVETKDDEDSK